MCLYALREHTPEQRALAEAAVKAAVQLRPDAGEAHLARANHLYAAYRDYDGALAELEIVRSKMPNSPRVFELTGYIARRRGAHDQGVRNLQHAVELDPRNFFTLQQLALSYKLLHRYSEEIATLDRALSIKPDDPETKGREASLSSTGKLTLKRSTKQLMRFAPKTPKRSRVSPMYGSSALWPSMTQRRQKPRLGHSATADVWRSTRRLLTPALGAACLRGC